MRMISMLLDKEMPAPWKGMEVNGTVRNMRRKNKDGISCSIFNWCIFGSTDCDYVGTSCSSKKGQR